MAKTLDPKCKQCRRESTKLFLKGERCFSPKCAILKRNYPPGLHGPKGRRRQTEYGQQLREKQKAKRVYGILERQFRNYYRKAITQKGDTGEIIQQLLEMRLDNVIYRLNLAKSRKQARQMVGHNLFLVNGKTVNIPSYQLKAKDEITIKPEKIKVKNFTDLEKKLEKQEAPGWISFDLKTKTAKILNKPSGSALEQIFNPRLIVEFYSR
ncbi:MAG: 30S ribosomal protein S4 [Patescibacteria group bacterium]|jgi:small subunit ribosomal protein S4